MEWRNYFKRFVREKSPPLFKLAKAAQKRRRLLGQYIPYYKALLLNKPYWGRVFASSQLGSERVIPVKSLIERELIGKSDFNILEIGSWAGGSAVLFASICKTFKIGHVFCVDTWAWSGYITHEKIKAALKRDRIYKLFKHNINSSKVSKYVTPIRMSSDEAAKHLAGKVFDIIYIDGDHRYSQVKRDLLNYKDLVKEGGILCGDDLELDFDKTDLSYNLDHCEEDHIQDPKTGVYYHPGVSRAVKEVLGNVSCKNGFWAIRKINNEFVDKITLD